MTTPEPINPFAIPAPFDVFGSGQVMKWTEDCPLVPWMVQGHLKLWVPVDHTDELLQRFSTDGPQPMKIVDTGTGTGHVVVVSGPPGSGKTSLINRCIDDLARRMNEYVQRSIETDGDQWQTWSGYPGVHVVTMRGFRNHDNGFSHEDGITLSVPELNRKIADEVVRKLTEAKVLPKEATDARLSSTRVSDVYAVISEELAVKEHFLLIVVPHVSWLNAQASQEFLGSCHSHAKTGIVFFLESSGTSMRQDVEDAFRRYQAKHLTHLEIGQMNPQDWESFIRCRTADNGLPGKTISITDEVVSNHPEARLYSNVRELQTFLYAISQEAIADGEEEIGMDRLRGFTQGRGRIDTSGFGY